MAEIRMTGEIRTDYDCETNGLPAEHWAEAVFRIGEDEIVLEVSVEKDIIILLSTIFPLLTIPAVDVPIIDTFGSIRVNSSLAL